MVFQRDYLAAEDDVSLRFKTLSEHGSDGISARKIRIEQAVREAATVVQITGLPLLSEPFEKP